MKVDDKHFKAFVVAVLGVIMAAACAGCDAQGESLVSNSWWNSFLDPTKPGNYREEKVLEIQKSISFRDKEYGTPGATEPTPGDLEAIAEEYRLVAGDTVRIRILDFLEPNFESEFLPDLDDLGYIDLPEVGLIKAEGLTIRELKQEIADRMIELQLFPADMSPTITAAALSRRNRVFNVTGVVAAPGMYVIPQADFRLREAINMAGGMDESIKVIYILRDEVRPVRRVEEAMDLPRYSRPGVVDDAGPPVVPILPAEFSATAGSPPAGSGPSTAPSPANASSGQGGGLVLPPDELERILDEATSPDAPEETGAGTDGKGPGIFVNNAFVEPAVDEEAAGPDAAATQPLADAAPLPGDEEIDWGELATEGRQRIIRIPADKLRHGDSSYNIVIRNQDMIRLDAGPVGVYYMTGEVSIPGVYYLQGREVTLRGAIAAASGLNQLAWPTRCEIVRRLDNDREELTQWNLARILDFKDPDLYLKPDDVVRVGTHAIAPLLATIRNSFRFTYGFGFVYDRNFADIDAYGQQINPQNLQIGQRQSLFDSLFR